MSNYLPYIFKYFRQSLLISLSFSFLFSCLAPCLTRRNDTPTAPVSIPTILEAQLYSSNLCNSSYAIDNDLITCQFTLMESYQPPQAHSTSPTLKGSSSTSRSSQIPSYYLYHSPHDLRHWTLTFRIQNGLLPDQSTITIQTLLYWIFGENYRYYGKSDAITYYAPIHLSYQRSSTDHFSTDHSSTNHSSTNRSFSGTISPDSSFSFSITANHSLIFLPPEQFITDNGIFWTVSVIDEAGNGPCCISIALESQDTLLYNLTEPTANHYCIDFYHAAPN